MCLSETYSRVQVGKSLSYMFPTKKGMKQRDALLSLLFNFPLENAIIRVQTDKKGLKLNGNISVWFMLMMLICWVETYVIQGKTKKLLIC